MIMAMLTPNSFMEGPSRVLAAGSAVSMGFDDAFSVYAITWALLFLVFLVHVVRSAWTIFIGALFYVSAQVWLLIGLVHGGYDMILVRPGVDSGVRIFWFVMGVLLVIVGAVHMQDWASMRADSRHKPRIGFPKFDVDPQGIADLFIVKLFLNLLYIVIAGLMGLLSVASCAFTLQDYDVFIMVLGTAQHESREAALQDALRYVGAYLWPSFAVSAAAVVFCLSAKVRKVFQDRFIKLKFVFALVFVVLGVGAIIGAL